MTEHEIRHLLRASREEGSRALFQEYWNYAYTVVFHILRSCAGRKDIEDCVTDVLSDVVLHFDAVHEGSLKAYIGTAARRRAIDAARASGRTVSVDGEEFPELASEDNLEETAERSELTRILLEQITALGEPDAAIILQKYFYERNSMEIARILNMNPVTVRSRCRRAIKRLKQALAEKGFDKEGLL